MAVVFVKGFDSQDILNIEDFSITGTASLNTSTVRTGAASVRCNPASGAQGAVQYVGAASIVGFVHFGLYVATLPSLARLVAGSGSGSTLKINPSGTLEVFDGVTSRGASTTALITGQWYWIGWRQSAGTSVPALQINGVTEVTATVTQGVLLFGFNDTVASAADAYFDDVIVDDAGFLASSKVSLLVPISDNARASLWTGGAGGTTSLFDAVNNTPPVGTATETNTTQIEHAGGAAGTTDAYDANMTTYATAGIAAADTVLAIEYFIAHGEDVGTGTKLLNFSLVSNPTQATGLANFAAGADVGALGTYATNWTVTRNSIIANPSVTVGTSPVMRVLRPETASRVASVCAMGMYVAWTPAVVITQIPYRNPMPPLIAQ